MTLLERFRVLVDQLMARVDYYAVRSARVVSQNDDGTLELRLDDPRFPDMGKVPVRFGLPGIKAKIGPGARALVTFENGDPSRPVVVSWDAESVLELVLGDQDGAAVARQGDSVVLTMPPVVSFTALLNGQTIAGTMQIPTPLSGIILTGSGRVKAAS